MLLACVPHERLVRRNEGEQPNYRVRCAVSHVPFPMTLTSTTRNFLVGRLFCSKDPIKINRVEMFCSFHGSQLSSLIRSNFRKLSRIFCRRSFAIALEFRTHATNEISLSLLREIRQLSRVIESKVWHNFFYFLMKLPNWENAFEYLLFMKQLVIWIFNIYYLHTSKVRIVPNFC